MAKIMTAVNPPTLAKAVGYSHAWEVQGGKILYLAGQVAFDKDSKVVGKGNIVAQFRQICENLRAVLQSRAGQMNDIVKLNIFVLDKADYQAHGKEIGAVYREYFGKHYPAMTLVEVKGLYDEDQGCLLEIEGVAILD
ncbi:MAG: RidA family protein [Candidatus Rokubacteria bacterium]|jgi:enamine deaminase RidA (YjgF/YER057c/UK114 family)|nr:RidA family protein [Candidatus Rokubacteria bacterium]